MAEILNVSAARGAPFGAGLTEQAMRPEQGWANIVLPDVWNKRWPGFDGVVWYRIEWQACEPAASAFAGKSSADPADPMAIWLEYTNMAGEGVLNGDRLWRDGSLAEPLSRNWNRPRYYVIPASSVKPGVNTLWVRVAGYGSFGAGLGAVAIGSPAMIEPAYEKDMLLRRSLPAFNLVIAAALGCIFLCVWLMLPKETAYGWYALTSFAWVFFGANTLVIDIWPFGSTEQWNRWVVINFLIYCMAFRMFTARFSGQNFRLLDQSLWGLTLVAFILLALVPASMLKPVLDASVLGGVLVLLFNCVLFQFYAFHTRKAEHIFLAVCMVVFLVTGTHDLMLFLDMVDRYGMTTVAAPVMMVCMSLLLAWRFAANMRRTEQFHHLLELRVSIMRRQLMDTLEAQHSLQLSNARLQERLQLSHDLHDGVGSSLVRAIAMVEQKDGPSMSRARYLSILKSLRADLRQVLDYTLAENRAVPKNPREWIAPLRRRYGLLFEGLGVQCEWRVADEWPQTLTPAQILALTRFVEEALTNVIKHSGATQVLVRLQVHEAGERCEACVTTHDAPILCVEVTDNGRGIDTPTHAEETLGIGLRSMRTRIERAGGQFVLHSEVQGGTTVRALLPVRTTDSASR